ncbi:putative metal-dependent HD superfamily phosphohydrolase [Naumannella cuiyingiana]|uniref:Putative metal-dependent HD superfamily phosphohydrolase n=1 Tax=Naumannella cuiyingiana TaxID=1347891 RepID=A0A7Z0D9Z1_9ACTN|nr:putative metal-dependent HD superfamily phosphohydrolase [Naumannella cuiyingiana]
MAVLIDRPIWPAHGTLFSHLVSDASLAELHRFAHHARVPARAFDRDHYDVAEHRHAELVAAGAVPVAGGELAARLRASGLRVTKRQHRAQAQQRRTRLSEQWQRLLPDRAALGGELIDRWAEPRRRYHDQQHLAECLAAVDELWPGHPRTLGLAVWFHDAVYLGIPGSDEEASALLAERRLAGVVSEDEVAEVARLVRLTAGHDPEPGDRAGVTLNDADLSILAAPADRYAGYLAGVRAEYHQLTPEVFAAGRRAVVAGLLERPVLFGTPAGRERWEAAARDNLTAELAGEF